MKRCDFDLITVGGGLGGSALAKKMAESGARVLVVERERQFSDRIHGERMAPWGWRRRSESGFTTHCSNDARVNCRFSTRWAWDRLAI